MNRITEALLGTASAGVVVTGMATLDGTVRAHIERVLSGEPLDQLSMAGLHSQRFANYVTETLSSTYSEHTALMSFGAGALLLVVLMLRT